MSLDAIAPLDGLRVSLLLVGGDAASAHYACTFLWSHKHEDQTEAKSATADAEVTVNPPNVEFKAIVEAPEEALVFARGVLRNIARSIDATTKWPRRITRWRDK